MMPTTMPYDPSMVSGPYMPPVTLGSVYGTNPTTGAPVTPPPAPPTTYAPMAGTPMTSPYTGAPLTYNPTTGLPTYAPQPSAPTGGNPMDPAYVKQQILATAAQMRAQGQYVNPSVLSDPDYWTNIVIQHGGWVNNGPNNNNIGYFTGRFGQPEGSGGGGSYGGGYPVGPTGGVFDSPLLQGFTAPFVPPTDPTGITMLNDPGYLERMKMGQRAVESSAAAKGTLLTGGTLKALTMFGQDYGSNEYQNVFNRAQQLYQNAYNRYGTAYNIFSNNQANAYNRLASMAGVGANTAGALNQSGQASANTIGGLYGQQGNVTAAGQVGSANAVAGGIAGVGGVVNNAILANSLNRTSYTPGTYGGVGTPGYPGDSWQSPVNNPYPPDWKPPTV